MARSLDIPYSRETPAHVSMMDIKGNDETTDDNFTQRDLMTLGNWHLFIVAMAMDLGSLGYITASEPDDRLFRQHIAPVLVARCLACHGTQKQEGGYSMTKLEQLFLPGDSGAKPIVAGEPASSELLRRLSSADPDERMPNEGAPLTGHEIEAVRQWIAAGAKLPGPGTRSLAEYVSATARQMHAPNRYLKRIPISAIAASQDGLRIYSSGYSEITVWDTGTGQLAQRIATGWPYVADIEISPDGQWLAVSVGVPGQTGVVQLHHLFDSQPTMTLASSSDIFADLAFSPDGQQLCMGGADGSLRIVELSNLELARQTDIQAVQSRQLASRPPEQVQQANPFLFRGKLKHQSTPHADRVNSVVWSSDGQHLLTASHDRTSKLFRSDSLDLVASFDRHDRTVGGAAFLGARPVTCDESGKLQVWSSDGADKAVAEKSGLARFAQRFCSARNELLVPQHNLVRRFTVQSKEVEAGKDEAGQRKTKTQTDIHELPALRSPDSVFIMSLTTTPDGFVFAGSDSGELLGWQNNTMEPTVRFVAIP